MLFGVLVKERLDVASKTFNSLLAGLSAKYHPTAMKKLKKDGEERLEFYVFPLAHWESIRIKNLIESTFVTVRLWVTRKARSTVVQQNNHFNDI